MPMFRKGEKGSLIVYANSITRTEKTEAGEDAERDTHFMKRLYSVQ